MNMADRWRFAFHHASELFIDRYGVNSCKLYWTECYVTFYWFTLNIRGSWSNWIMQKVTYTIWINRKNKLLTVKAPSRCRVNYQRLEFRQKFNDSGNQVAWKWFCQLFPVKFYYRHFILFFLYVCVEILIALSATSILNWLIFTWIIELNLLKLFARLVNLFLNAIILGISARNSMINS